MFLTYDATYLMDNFLAIFKLLTHSKSLLFYIHQLQNCIYNLNKKINKKNTTITLLYVISW